MAAEMLDCAQNAKEAEGTIASMIMEAMENYISENASKKTGEMLAENANDILEKAEELSKELGRKVTVEELSEETGISEEKSGTQPESPQIILNFWSQGGLTHGYAAKSGF